MFTDRCRESQMCRLKQDAMQGPTAFWGNKRRVHWRKNACCVSIKTLNSSPQHLWKKAGVLTGIAINLALQEQSNRKSAGGYCPST